MKVLLLSDVEKIGWIGDVVDVKDGYARNYLISQGLAKAADQTTPALEKALAKERARRAEQRVQERGKLEQIAEAVNGAEAVIAAKANEQGHLFGSVGARQIAVNLREQGFEIADGQVELPGHIKQVGTSEVKLKFADDLTAVVKVVVVAGSEEI